MKKSKKKAFTLTELLVVVIVIGVLSAAVLPKFSKVIETRKTTEAEELMASVRTEQEKRCALDKQYLTQMSEMTDIVKNNGDTKNFTITLAERGIDAESKGKYTYTLKMPSYADGRICCDGTGCNKLNKNYPTCEELRKKPDYQESPADCAGVISEPEEPSGPCDIDPYSCECDPNQAKCCAEDEVWQDGKCSPKPKECTGPKPATSQECNKCGTKTQTVTCDTTTGEWVEGGFGECSIDDETKCEEASTCYAKDEAGELKSYCAQHGLFPGWNFYPKTPLSPSNCCQSCEDAGGIMNKGECVYGGWYAEQTSSVNGLKYTENTSVVTLREDTWGWGADGGGMLAQYGTNYGGSFGHDCDFSGSGTISVEDLDNFDQEKFAKQCQRCGLKDTCSATAYEWFYRGSSRWNLLYSASTLGAKGACDLIQRPYSGPALGDLANNEDVTLSGRHCGDETLGPGDLGCPPYCGTDYSGIQVSISSAQREKLQQLCDQYKSAQKYHSTGCWTATGIPSSAYSSSYSSTFGLDGNVYGSVPSSSSDCQVSIRVSGAKVWGTLLKKWTCVKNYDAGQPLFE